MRILLLVPVLLLLGSSPLAYAEEDGPSFPETVTVVTKEAPPFSMKNDDGSWHGISIDLWNRMATQLGFATDFQERELDVLLEEVRDGKAEAGVAALTVTSDREAQLDFSHAFYSSGLGIAARTEGESGWKAIVSRVFSLDFLKTLLVLIAVLAGAGFLLWLFERRRNREQFGGKAAQGLGHAFWWSAVTMTTVGYGDKAPISFGGRVVAMVWMFASMLVIASITASMASALTVSKLEGSVHGPDDLPGLRVGTIPGSTSERWLGTRNVRRSRYDSIPDALAALARKDVDAVVYDHPLLVYHVKRDSSLSGQLTVLPAVFERQDYAIALPQGSPYREQLNRSMLEQISAPTWDDVLDRYLGR